MKDCIDVLKVLFLILICSSSLITTVVIGNERMA